MLKKILSLTVAALLLAGLSACSGTPSVGVDSSSLEPLVIGGIGHLTEASGGQGQSVYRGAQTAVEEINATGGVNGFRLVLNFQDSKGDPQTALSVYDKLLDNGMKVLISAGTSGETEAVVPSAAKDGILTLTSTTGPSALGTEGNVFRVSFSDARVGTVTANFIADQHLADRVSVIWKEGSSFGEGQAQAFQTAFSGRGGSVEMLKIPAGTPSDDAEVIDALMQSPPEMIFLALSAEETAAFLINYGWNGNSSPVKIIGNAGTEGLPELTAPSRWEGICTLTPFSADDASALVQNFVSTYREKYKTAPDRYAAEGYDAVYAVAEALKKGGITPDDMDGKDFGKLLISAMTKITVNGVTGASSWTADGETTRAASFKVLRNGRQVPFTKEEAAYLP